MSSYDLSDQTLSSLEEAGLVTKTFRRLEPAKREAVVQAIFEEGAARGAEAAGMREVAKRADVSVGSLYQYFGSRERMIEFACSWVAQSLAVSFAGYGAWARAAPLEDTLRATLEYGIKWCEENPALLRFFAASAYSLDSGGLRARLVEPVARATRELVRAAVEGAAARGELAPGVGVDHAARILSLLLFTAGDAFLLPPLDEYWAFAAGADRKELVESLIGFALRGLGTRR